jgi:hypothetical protein
MIVKFINSSLIGFVLVMLIEFLLFIGVKLNYFDYYNIKEFYNIIFFDNNPFIITFLLMPIVGYAFLYSKYSKIVESAYIVVLFLSFTTFYSHIGKKLGESFFRKDDLNFRVGKIVFQGSLLYNGRKMIYIYRKDIDKVIVLESGEVEVLE